jgi:hypothetical protein
MTSVRSTTVDIEAFYDNTPVHAANQENFNLSGAVVLSKCSETRRNCTCPGRKRGECNCGGADRVAEHLARVQAEDVQSNDRDEVIASRTSDREEIDEFLRRANSQCRWVTIGDIVREVALAATKRHEVGSYLTRLRKRGLLHRSGAGTYRLRCNQQEVA